MKSIFKRVVRGTAIAGAVVAPVAAHASSSDPIATATAQFSTWQPEILTLLGAAFLVAVAFKALGLGKRGIKSA
jgi:hypothetical protein